MKSNKSYWIRKYAILLFCFFVIQSVAAVLFSTYVEGWLMEGGAGILMTVLPYSLALFMMGIIVAVVVYYDIRALRIEAKYAVLSTAIFVPFGVCLFLLYVILSEIDKSTKPETVGQP